MDKIVPLRFVQIVLTIERFVNTYKYSDLRIESAHTKRILHLSNKKQAERGSTCFSFGVFCVLVPRNHQIKIFVFMGGVESPRLTYATATHITGTHLYCCPHCLI